MGSTDIYFKIIVLLGLFRAARYNINTPKICASIWFVTRISSGFFAKEALWSNVFLSIVAFGFSWWMFDLLKSYDKWTLPWVGISALGMIVLCIML